MPTLARMPLSRFSSTSTAIPAYSHNDTPEGKQALVWHQAHAREDWHRKPADFKKKASIHNNVAQHLLSPLCTSHGTFLHPHAPCAAPTRTAFTAPLRSTRGTFSYRCVSHMEPFCTPTHHVAPSPTPFMCTLALHARHLLTPLCTTHGTFLHPHAPRCTPTRHVAPSCTAYTCTLVLHARHFLTPLCTTHGTFISVVPVVFCGESMTAQRD